MTVYMKFVMIMGLEWKTLPHEESVKSSVSLQLNIHKGIWTSPDGKNHKQMITY